MQMRPGKGHHTETRRFPEMKPKAYCSSNPSWIAPCSLVHKVRVLEQQGLSFQDSSFQDWGRRVGQLGVERRKVGMCWGAGETNIWDGHCPSSLPKPQTLWQQENRSGSDQGLRNPGPGRASAGGGSGDLGSETESTSEVRLDTHRYCTMVSTLDSTARKIQFLV